MKDFLRRRDRFFDAVLVIVACVVVVIGLVLYFGLRRGGRECCCGTDSEASAAEMDSFHGGVNSHLKAYHKLK